MAVETIPQLPPERRHSSAFSAPACPLFSGYQLGAYTRREARSRTGLLLDERSNGDGWRFFIAKGWHEIDEGDWTPPRKPAA